LVLRTTVLPQLLLLTKKRKEEVDRTVINCLRRVAKRAKKEKSDEIEQDKKEEIEE
jgi:hypothetical protein